MHFFSQLLYLFVTIIMFERKIAPCYSNEKVKIISIKSHLCTGQYHLLSNDGSMCI